MSIVAWLLLGLVAGWLAGLVMGGRRGILGNVIVGMIGALIAGFVGSMLLGWDVTGFNPGSREGQPPHPCPLPMGRGRKTPVLLPMGRGTRDGLSFTPWGEGVDRATSVPQRLAGSPGTGRRGRSARPGAGRRLSPSVRVVPEARPRIRRSR
jgi:uncharacterized membrane protein YeaQ/YmgE (transglycosylase-associated protein family)